MRQTYTKDQIISAIEPYDVGSIIEFHYFEVGIENTNIYIKTQKGEFVLKFFEKSGGNDLMSAEFEVSLMERAWSCGLLVPKPLAMTDGRVVRQVDGKPTVLMTFLDGENIYNRQVSLEFISEVGNMAARLDKCFVGFNPTGHESSEHYWDLKRFEVSKRFLPFLKDDKSADVDFINQIYHDYKNALVPAFDKLQKGYIHNDIAAHNILSKNGRLSGLVDFGDAVNAYLVFEVAVTIAQLCMLQNDWQKAIKAFVQSYCFILPLCKEELDILYDLVCCRSANMVVVCNGLYHSDSPRQDYIWFRDQGVENLKKLKKLGKQKFDELIYEATNS